MTAVLRHVGLEPQDLLTLDDLPDIEPRDTRFLLVDHNSPTGVVRRFGDRVVGTIDHHADEGHVPADCGEEPRLIETCGSCVSLITHYCREVWDDLAREGSSSADAAAADKAMALMALAVIFSDTVNLTAKDKVMPKDTSAVEYLEAKLEGSGYDRQAYCDKISAVRLDLSDLSLRDIFRKDYKEWVSGDLRLGTCSVVQNFGYMLGRAGSEDVLVGELGRWAEEKQLDLVSVMTLAIGDGKYERELLLWGRNDRAVRAAKKFSTDYGEELGLSPLNDGALDVDGETDWRRVWKQGSVKQSRKQIAPLIRKAME
ncbi:related to exopolyphosphatase [Cephalotrichum gorgonifer]|uniref:Related to exopolyphosphatase n=1 Tax=Cephalotrichum gorgonifer TaxID=2041049 RepID=A0AAE8SSQ9_9PEZI|nr:related to exopolyphosphatase [Cephalotrichum gorgonifer]